MKKKLILAALLMSMAVTVFAEEELIWEEQTATEDVMYAFEEEDTSSEEQTAAEDPEYVFEEQETIEEQITEEDVVSEEIAFDQPSLLTEEVIQEDSVFEEELVSEETAGEETAAASTTAVAVEGLIYTGEPQTLITAQDGGWSYSLDGEEYSTELPTGVNAGEYTVYMKNGETVEVVTVTIAKADVVFTAPVANTTSYEPDEGNEADEAAPAGEENETDEEPAETGEGVAYAAGEAVVEEVVFEE